MIVKRHTRDELVNRFDSVDVDAQNAFTLVELWQYRTHVHNRLNMLLFYRHFGGRVADVVIIYHYTTWI